MFAVAKHYTGGCMSSQSTIPEGEVIMVRVLPSTTVQLIHLVTGTTLRVQDDTVVLEERRARLTEIFPEERGKGYVRTCLTPHARAEFWNMVKMLRLACTLQQRAGRHAKAFLEPLPQAVI